MRKFLFMSLLTMTVAGYAQVKPSLIGFSVNTVNFTGSSALSGKYDPGFSIVYWKGLGKLVDLSLRYNGLFSDYNKTPGNSSDYVNEFEGSLHLRAMRDVHFFNPFLSAGIGAGKYGDRWAAYTPLGGGIQLRLDEENYVFLQANYRVSLQRDHLDDNLFFSLGFTESIGSPRKAPVPAPLPPAPVVVITDRDKDGVPDSTDACPDIAGLPSLNGCPDSDGDGIADKDDKCPNEKGTAKYQGCPVPDSDGDGINDEEDSCPQQKGVAKYKGCPIPDSDGDGVNDEEDKCPNLAGDPANQGCPVIREEVKKRVDHAAQHIYFATGKAVLLKKSFPGLDEVQALLKSDPALKLYVDGYTDNTGRPESNRLLSEKRAASVRTYLTGKGVDGTRILSAGHGDSDPVADNKTAAGRAKNRRVVLKLDYQ